MSKTVKKHLKRSEHEEQCDLFKWAQEQTWLHQGLHLMFAIPNGARVAWTTAKKLKAEGMKKGVPDIFLPVPSGDFHGLFIEMKVKPNKLKPEQYEWIGLLQEKGYKAVVCYSCDEAIKQIIVYLGSQSDESQ